jgi:microbial collagenase
MKWTSVALAMTVAAGSSASLAEAMSNGGQAKQKVHPIMMNALNKKELQKLVPSAAPLGEMGEVTLTLDSEDAGISEPQPRSLKSSRTSERSTYSMAELNSMSYTELTNLLTRIQWEEIPELFQYNEDTRRFYSDEKRVQAVIDQLEESGRRFTPEDDQGILTLVEVLRSAFYLGYYNKDLKYLDQSKFREKLLPAMNAIIDNPSFAWGTETQNEVIGAMGKMISNSTVDADTINRLTGTISSFIDRKDTLSKDFMAGTSFHDVISGVGYVLMWRIMEPEQKAPFKGEIDGYLEQLFRLAQDNSVTPDNQWLTSNSVYYAGALGQYYSDPQKANKILTDVMHTAPNMGELYFVAADQIAQNYGGTDALGRKINMDELKQRGKEYYLPKRTEFDDGKFVFQTGSSLSDEQLQRLYWAAKEVKAQFHRVIGNDKALEEGNPDDVLTIVIYNNPDEYKMNRFLYGFDTENGGIYIEPSGTFFTYDRTEKQSIYSLEELFRHEFTHYLQGRYEVPGMWGQGLLYQGGRMQWFDEGGAEFFAGSTRTQGIQPRQSVVSNLVGDTPAERYSVSDTLNSKYGSWKFYHYSFALFDYMYHQDFTAMDRIHSAIRTNDAAAYEQQLTSMSSDERVNESYQRSIDDNVSRYDSLSVPLVSDDYLRATDPKPVQEIYDEITATAGLEGTSMEQHKSPFFQSFEVRGTYVGGVSKGKEQDWQTMNTLTDDFLQSLSGQQWNGYKTLTAYFTNYHVDNDGHFVFDVVFHGKLPEGADVGEVEKQPGGSPDGSKGETGGSNESKENGNEGGQTTPDRESHDTWQTAVRLDGQGTAVSGKVSKSNPAEIYRFDTKENDEWTIELDAKQARGTAWVLFHESDPENYESYPTKIEGTNIGGTLSVKKPGTYYLHVYAAADGDQSYKLSVKNETQSDQKLELPLFMESEPNDAPDKANGPVLLGQSIKGTLEGNDYQDVFLIDLKKPKELRIELEKQLGNSVNWVLYREGDLENQVMYPVETSDKWMNAEGKVEPGRYHLFVYKYTNEDVHYQVNIK